MTRGNHLLAALLAGLIAVALPAQVQAQAEELATVLRIDEVVEVMRDEGLAHGEELDSDMLDGEGGQPFADRISRIYDTGTMAGAVLDALGAGMSAQHIEQSIGFFSTERGQRILALETAARVAMADPVVEEIARQTYGDLMHSADPRFDAVAEFIAVNDLLERNVSGALNSNYDFYRGLVDGGALKMSEAGILAEVWSDEDELREDTEGWLFAFLLMAYQPLSDEDMQAYTDFSVSPAGQSLNGALFDGFDVMYRSISYALGRAVAQSMATSDL